MRISDWSSDVCSSDLLAALQLLHDALGDFLADALLDGDELAHRVAGGLLRLAEIAAAGLDLPPRQIGAPQLVHLAQLQVHLGDAGEHPLLAPDGALGDLEFVAPVVPASPARVWVCSPLVPRL